MYHLLMVVLSFLLMLLSWKLVVVTAIPDRTCPMNKVYSSCHSGCPTKCTNMYDEQSCQLGCVQGCYCKQGLVESRQGSCVLPSQCSCEHQGKILKAGERYESYEDCTRCRCLRGRLLCVQGCTGRFAAGHMAKSPVLVNRGQDSNEELYVRVTYIEE